MVVNNAGFWLRRLVRDMTGMHGPAILLLLVTFFARARTTPIWRCPSFKLLPCKTLPRECTSYRMIYIRHVHLECPACLICADPWVLKPWSIIESTTTNGASTKETRRQRRRRLKKKVRRGERGRTPGRTPRERSPRTDRERIKRRRKRRKERQRLAAEAAAATTATVAAKV